MPPSLFLYDTTVVLSDATRTILFKQRSRNSFRARKTAACYLEGVLVLGVPHPSFDVSVKICRACFSGCNG